MHRQLSKDFIAQCLYRMDENTRMLKIALSTVSEEELWKKPNAHLNSIGNLLLHLCGNITQYAIASLGNQHDDRNRPQEFLTEGGYTKQELLDQLEAVLQKAGTIFENTSEEKLLKMQNVQGFHLSGIGIILHVVEHYSYHTGQIAFWVKLLKNKDLGFYQSFDLNQTNS